uniref:Mitochondrial inner membrane protease ATP23 n=1 Tax=Cyprinus carpio TaxID=7962 RepID=A0A8C1P197_CYPCA
MSVWSPAADRLLPEQHPSADSHEPRGDIHALDHCRARVDWFNSFRHLACSEIRAASLSGDCSFVNEISRFNFGLKEHHQVCLRGSVLDVCVCVCVCVCEREACVRGRALRSIIAVCKVSREEAELELDEVFDSCFCDPAPFGRVPHSKKDAKFAYRDNENRDWIYANL